MTPPMTTNSGKEHAGEGVALKPCPFCGGAARAQRKSGVTGQVCRSRYYRERVICKSCGAGTDEHKAPGKAVAAWNRRTLPAGYRIVGPGEVDRETLEKAATAGWEACRRSIYKVCEDVQSEADRLQMSTKPRDASEEQHAKGFYAGSRYTAKSIARGFCAMSGMDDDHLTTAIEALRKEGGE